MPVVETGVEPPAFLVRRQQKGARRRLVQERAGRPFEGGGGERAPQPGAPRDGRRLSATCVWTAAWRNRMKSMRHRKKTSRRKKMSWEQAPGSRASPSAPWCRCPANQAERTKYRHRRRRCKLCCNSSPARTVRWRTAKRWCRRRRWGRPKSRPVNNTEVRYSSRQAP